LGLGFRRPPGDRHPHDWVVGAVGLDLNGLRILWNKMVIASLSLFEIVLSQKVIVRRYRIDTLFSSKVRFRNNYEVAGIVSKAEAEQVIAYAGNCRRNHRDVDWSG
jgi:hypothetical protein